MKKFTFIIVSTVCILALSACGKKASPIVLPDAEKIRSVNVIDGELTATYEDSTWIEDIISGIAASEPTNKESIQDAPQNKDYIRVDFWFEEGTSTLFAYEEKGKYYVEQPYQGIYRIDDEVYEKLRP